MQFVSISRSVSKRDRRKNTQSSFCCVEHTSEHYLRPELSCDIKSLKALATSKQEWNSKRFDPCVNKSRARGL